MEVAAEIGGQLAMEEQERRAAAADLLLWQPFNGIVGEDNDTIMIRHTQRQLKARYQTVHPADVLRAVQFADAAVATLTTRVGQSDARADQLVLDWFKIPAGAAADADQVAALDKLKSDFVKIAALLHDPGGTFYLSFSPPGRTVAAQSERIFIWKSWIALYPLHVADIDAERRATTLVHEASHHVAATSDWVYTSALRRDVEIYVYGAPSNAPPVKTDAWQATTWKGRSGNADTFAYFARDCFETP